MIENDEPEMYTRNGYGILRQLRFFKSRDQIERIESLRNAKFVGEFSLPVNKKDLEKGFVNTPVAIFYQEVPHPEGSNYFGLYYDDTGKLWVTDAGCITMFDWPCLFVPGQNIMYSAYRHDYQAWGEYSIDGGMEYTKISWPLGQEKVLGYMKVVNGAIAAIQPQWSTQDVMVALGVYPEYPYNKP